MQRPDRPFSPRQTTAKPRLLDQVSGMLHRKHYIQHTNGTELREKKGVRPLNVRGCGATLCVSTLDMPESFQIGSEHSHIRLSTQNLHEWLQVRRVKECATARHDMIGLVNRLFDGPDPLYPVA